MAKKPPKLPDAARMLRELQRSVQVVRTVLHEAGVKLEPETAASLKLRPGISRVWATMFGRDDSNLRIATVDGMGNTVIRPPRWEQCVTTVKTSAFVEEGGEDIVDFGKVVDFVHIFTVSGMFWGEFSFDNDHYRNRRHGTPSYRGLTPRWCALDIFTRCQYVKIHCTRFVNTNAFDVIGETFPT